MDRAKLLSRIQKCLNLSKSSEPHEAAAALRQAQKMMEVFGVTERELGAIGYTGEKVSCPIQAGDKVPPTLNMLIHMLREAFGVRSVLSREVRISDASFCVHYFGPEDRTMLAALGFAWAGWKRYANKS